MTNEDLNQDGMHITGPTIDALFTGTRAQKNKLKELSYTDDDIKDSRTFYKILSNSCFECSHKRLEIQRLRKIIHSLEHKVNQLTLNKKYFDDKFKEIMEK